MKEIIYTMSINFSEGIKMDTAKQTAVINLTREIVAAYVSRNSATFWNWLRFDCDVLEPPVFK